MALNTTPHLNPNTKQLAALLNDWFKLQLRAVPWRKTPPNPYHVWVSEVMLQQTTTTAVKPYFKNFITKWPKITDLALASQEEVNAAWAGLGYYSRAKNLLKTAQIVSKDFNGLFPTSPNELIKLPGIGPYTANALSSICFNEPVGVVDGNVLRVYNRLLGKKIKWWEKDFFTQTQNFTSELCQHQKPGNINQALMDLGATLCTPKKTQCFLCPIKNHCVTFKKGLQNILPLPKPRKQNEFWSYEVYVPKKNINKIPTDFSENLNAPVLHKKLLPVGKFTKLNKRPTQYQFTHTITHHKIYVSFKPLPDLKSTGPKPKKLRYSELKRLNPSSLIEKIWQELQIYENI